MVVAERQLSKKGTRQRSRHIALSAIVMLCMAVSTHDGQGVTGRGGGAGRRGNWAGGRMGWLPDLGTVPLLRSLCMH